MYRTFQLRVLPEKRAGRLKGVARCDDADSLQVAGFVQLAEPGQIGVVEAQIISVDIYLHAVIPSRLDSLTM